MIERYLANYTEPEARAFGMAHAAPANLNGRPLQNTRVWQGCLVIPAFDEAFEPLHRQLTSLSSADVLAILVINAPENANPKAIANTQNLLKQLHEQDYEHVIVVDRASDGLRLNPKQGVGLARKIGCDLALALRLAGRARSDWLLQSDADVVFLRAIPICCTKAPSTIPLAHESFRTIITAATLPCITPVNSTTSTMSYYVAGLAMAGSGYAHHSLGSTIAVHATSYAAVRGYQNAAPAKISTC